MSGIPIIGGIFLLGASLLLPASPIVGWLLLAFYLADAGGIPWVIFYLLRDGA